MSARIDCSGLSVARQLYDLIENEVAAGAGLNADAFWSGLAGIVSDLAPKNRELLDKRLKIQESITNWHHQHPGEIDFPAYKKFLTDMGYLIPEGDEFIEDDPEGEEIGSAVDLLGFDLLR